MISFFLVGLILVFSDYVYGTNFSLKLTTGFHENLLRILPPLIAFGVILLLKSPRNILELATTVLIIFPLSLTLFLVEQVSYYWLVCMMLMAISYYLVSSRADFKNFNEMTQNLAIEIIALTSFCFSFYLSLHLGGVLESLVNYFMVLSAVIYLASFILGPISLSNTDLYSFTKQIYTVKTLVFFKSILVFQNLYFNLPVIHAEFMEFCLYSLAGYLLVTSALSSLIKDGDSSYPLYWLMSQLSTVILISLIDTSHYQNFLFYILILDGLVTASFLFLKRETKKKPEYFLFLLNSLFVPITISFFAKVLLLRLLLGQPGLFTIGLIVMTNHVVFLVVGIRKLSQEDLLSELKLIGKKNLAPSTAKTVYLSCVIISTCLLVFI